MNHIEDFPFQSVDGLTCHGYLSIADRESPCLVELPAGVNSSFKASNRYQTRFFEELDRFLNEKGITVFHIDRRGAAGYERSEELRDYGGKDVGDILNGTESLIKSGRVNPKKVGIYATCSSCLPAVWALNKSDVYDVGILVSGIYNLEMQKGFEETYNPNHPLSKLIGAENLEGFHYRERSPVNGEIDISAPLLFLHGLDDFVSLSEQSQEMYKKLKGSGVDVQYIERDSLPHNLNSSNPYSKIGSEVWKEILSFLNDKEFI